MFDKNLECMQTVSGHTNWVFALTSANDRIFSGSSDHTIKVFIFVCFYIL